MKYCTVCQKEVGEPFPSDWVATADDAPFQVVFGIVLPELQPDCEKCSRCLAEATLLNALLRRDGAAGPAARFFALTAAREMLNVVLKVDGKARASVVLKVIEQELAKVKAEQPEFK
jgi:hypothetical protein